MNPSYMVVEDFFEQASVMRERFEQHFGSPHNQPENGDLHRIWDYWYVPQLYTYLRTSPQKVFPPELAYAFYECIKAWAIRTLGLSHVSWPYLSLYVNGCGQGLHNDAGNGRWGYVYSLTKWDERKFLGGETLLFKEQNYWESELIRQSGAGSGFYELIPSRFNQLLVFDDRVIHGVSPLQGLMDPLEGRVVIHGHISEDGVIAEGGMTQELANSIFETASPILMERLKRFGPHYHGLLTARLQIRETGTVTDVQILSNRILKTARNAADPAAILEQEIVDYLKNMSFPAVSAPTILTLPIRMGNPLS